MTRYSGLSRWWWDKVLDGNVYRLVREGLPNDMNLVSLRGRFYYESSLRGLIASTHWPRRQESALYVQALPDGSPENSFAYLADPSRPYLPMPDVGMEDPVQVAAALAKKLADDEELLGPCTCGQAPKCLHTCARANGGLPPLPVDWQPPTRPAIVD